MKLYVTSSNNWAVELANVLRVAKRDDVIIVDSEAKRELAERAAKRMGFAGRIGVR